MTVTLRDYQLHAIELVRAEFRAGNRSVVMVSPTGSGKSAVAASMVHQAVHRGHRVLWVAHRTELIEQAARTLSDFGLRVGVIAASSQLAPNPYAAIQVASVDTLNARGSRPEASLIICDEFHHYRAKTYEELVDYYRPRAHIVGPTATPERQDGLGLRRIADGLVTVISIRELTDMWREDNSVGLVPLEVISPDRPLQPGEIAQAPVDAYREYAPGERALVFAPHLRAAAEYLDGFTKAGIPSAIVDGAMPLGERRDALRRICDGDLRALVNVGICTEGTDLPPVSACILARGCGSPGLLIQIVGRVLRPSPGKTLAKFIDLRGMVHIHGRPDEDRIYSLDGRGIRRENEPAVRMCQCGKPLADDAVICPNCGRGPKEMEIPQVVHAKLRKYDHIRRDSDSERVMRLVKWIRECILLGHKPGKALYKYNAVYGMWPSPSIRDTAIRIAREESF